MMTIINGIKSMFHDHWCWGFLAFACIVWYSTITIYVAIKGSYDIRNMLRTLSKSKDN